MTEHETNSVNSKEDFFTWQRPVLDIRVVTALLCFFMAGIIASVNLDTHIAAVGSGYILMPLLISVAKYALLISLCMLSIKYRFCISLLFIYAAICSIIAGFYIPAFFSLNTAVLAGFVLPLLIYFYIVTALSSELLHPRKKELHFEEESAIISLRKSFLCSLVSRSKIILLGIILESVLAPFINYSN